MRKKTSIALDACNPNSLEARPVSEPTARVLSGLPAGSDQAEPRRANEEEVAAHAGVPRGAWPQRTGSIERDAFAVLAGRSPLWVAAGPWSSGEQSTETLATAGAVIAKTVTAEPRAGNPPPVLQSYSRGGYLNRIGLRNVGAHEFVRARLPIVQACQAPIIQSFTAQSEDEVEVILHALADQPIVGLELNASCPNAPSGQLEDRVLRSVLRRARQLTRRPIWVKLAYAPAEVLRARAQIIADEGADGITAINTMHALDVTLPDALPSTPSPADVSLFRGGVSGPTLTPLAQWAVDFLVREQPLPVIACGGVSSLREVLAFAALGATAVQVGSALLDDAAVLPRLQRELAQVAQHSGVTSWQALIEVLCPHKKS